MSLIPLWSRSLARAVAPNVRVPSALLGLWLALGLGGAPAFAQTDPPAQSLPYAQDFASLTPGSVTSLPTGWAAWTLGSAASTSYRTTAAAADLALTADGTAASDASAAYNYLDKPGFLDSDSLDAALALAINTTGRKNVVINYDVMTLRNPADGSPGNDRISLTTLQYRVGTSGAFTTLAGLEHANSFTPQLTGTAGQSLGSRSITLPSNADDAPVVQLRWVSRDSAGTGERSSVAIDNVSATGTAFFTITATAGANGIITPAGSTPVDSAAGQSYTITPDAGYIVQDVLVDGVSVGAVTSYSFSNVTTAHTIAASFTLDPTSTVSAGSPGVFVTTVSPTVSIPVTLSRAVATPMLGFSVDITLSAGLTTSPAAILEGGFLTASGGTTNFQVVDHGGGQYTIDGVTLGLPCGSTALNDTLFTIGVGSTLMSGIGTVTIDSVRLRDCDNVSLAAAIGTAASVDIDRSLPVVTVTAPNGGESWLAGTVQAITWTASDVEGIAANGVTLEYSIDNGSNWLPVASALANSGSFNWTVPNTPTAAARVRATATDLHANVASDTSDAVSTIQGLTTTTLATAPNPSVVGESVTLTATVSPSTAAGSVEFFDGATSLGTGTLSAGSATLNTSAFGVGAHSLTAVYAGEPLHAGSTSAVHTHTVSPGSTTTTVASTPNPSVYGDSVAITVTVAASAPAVGTPTGSVELFDGATSLGSQAVSGGAAVFQTAALAAGVHTLSAVYAGDASFSGSTSAGHTHTVNQASTSTAVTTTPNPTVAGESAALVATVTPAVASGSVEFFDGAASLGTAALSAGSATLNTAGLGAGSHSITAVYLGDANYSTSTSAAHTHTVDPASTTTLLASSVNPSLAGEPVTLTASVAAVAPSTGTPGGFVEFFNGAASLGTVALSSGSATLVTSTLPVGTHSLTAVYAGTADYLTSTSAAVAQVVDSGTTTTTVTSAPNPSVSGEPVAISVAVAPNPPAAGTATGSVELFDGVTSLGTQVLSGGGATFNTAALATGVHSLTAVYTGDANFTGSTSAAHTHTVDSASTTTTIASDLNPSAFGQLVTFTASVSVVAPGVGTPSGTVTFFDGASSIGTGTLSGGTATLATSALAAGTHSITASYEGDGSFSGSTSAVLSQVVNAAATSVTLAAAPDPGIYQDNTTLTATVTPSVASGSVEFFDGASPLGVAALSGGTASIVTNTLAVGVHALTAVYSGDLNHAGATSAVDSLEIQASIVATAGANGSISPAGTTLHSLGATPSFTFTADPGYHVASVTVDGGAAALTSPYTFGPISSNHTIDVQFAVNPAVAAITTLSAAQVRTGNDSDGNTQITLSWSPVPVGSTVEVWRKGYGNYPEYDDGPSPGSVPAAPVSYPPAGWTLTSVSAPGTTDEPSSRDFYYYVAYVVDQYGTRSDVSNRTNGTLNYHLGDVSDGVTPGQGNNTVSSVDLSELGAHYGITGPAVDAFNYLDVGPTTNLTVHARPSTDNRVNFEDLVFFAINYAPVTSGPLAKARPAAAGADALTLSVGEARLGESLAARVAFTGTGRLQAIAVKLTWDPAVVEPVSYTAGDLVLAQGGVVFSAEPGSVDGASFAGAGQGLVGDGEFATVQFRVKAAGDPKIAFARVEGRDAENRSVDVTSRIAAVTPRTFATAFAPAMPNPFNQRTTFRFSLARAGRAELQVFSVDGRLVRTLSTGVREAGEYQVEWNGSDDSGRALNAGVYYARLQTAQGHWTRVVTYLK